MKMSTRKDVEFIVNKIMAGFSIIDVDDIPKIDLYMDQVLTFLGERLKRTARKSDADKLLTKTMINNYVKNKVLIPPVKKKYGRDHILLLMVIYYMKNFLAIDDIRRLSGQESDREVARLLGADSITEAALQNAREMKEMAMAEKGRQV
jgi:hypothetical protein